MRSASNAVASVGSATAGADRNRSDRRRRTRDEPPADERWRALRTPRSFIWRCRLPRCTCCGGRDANPSIDRIGLSASGSSATSSTSEPPADLDACSLTRRNARGRATDRRACHALSAPRISADAHDANRARSGRRNRCALARPCGANLSSVRHAVRGSALPARIQAGDWHRASRPKPGRIWSQSPNEQRRADGAGQCAPVRALLRRSRAATRH